MSSSDDSFEEEEVVNNFDIEAAKIVQLGTLPKKSSERYLLVYETYKKWQQDHQDSLSNSVENNLIVYFNELKEKVRPPTLWSIWSMLRSTLNTHEDFDISKYSRLKSLLKNIGKGYQPKKALVFKWDQIVKFINEAPDQIYLAVKVILIFGISGALRCDELTRMEVKDVEDLGNKYLVSIQDNKNDYSGQFIIGNLFYDTVKRYISSRPADNFSTRFFIQYQNGKAIRQPIGRHKISSVPETIATYLQLENPKRYTGHTLRRTSATLLSESGANMQTIKQLGRWRSDMIAQGYIENSLLNRQMIFEKITHEATRASATTSVATTTRTTKSVEAATTLANCSRPSTSTSTEVISAIGKCETSNTYLNWSDFEEELTVNNLDNDARKPEEIQSVTQGNQKVVLDNPKNYTELNKGTKFHTKPPVKLVFKRKSEDTISNDESPTNKRRQLQNSNQVFTDKCFKDKMYF